MRIAFVGKGGSGKTTLSSLFIRTLAHQNVPILAIDADLNQHLADAIGMQPPEQALGLNQVTVKSALAADSPLVCADQMIKTTPPTNGSKIFRSITELPLAFPELIAVDDSLFLANVGKQQEEDVGIRCYHSKTGIVELLLNHLVEREDEVVVVDMVAGADAFASGLYAKFDLTVLVVEPTQKSVAVWHQYATQATKRGVTIAAVGNKVQGDDDAKYLKENIGDLLLGCMTHSPFVRCADKGQNKPISELEPENAWLMSVIQTSLMAQEKNWDNYHKTSVEIHRNNAHSWANKSAELDLTEQIDPAFTYDTYL